MRYKKVRGHSRIQQNIHKWIDNSIDLDIERLKEFSYQYERINILPWMNQPIINSKLSEPNGYTKNMILEGLEIIYNNWKSQLEKLDQPYYLKIWLNEPRISKSEVVCGIKENIAKFENFFSKINLKKNNSNLINSMSPDFKWECAVDEDFIFENEVSQENFLLLNEFFSERRLLNKAKMKGYRNEIVENSSGEKEKVYFIPKGKIWIGGK